MLLNSHKLSYSLLNFAAIFPTQKKEKKIVKIIQTQWKLKSHPYSKMHYFHDLQLQNVQRRVVCRAFLLPEKGG